MPSRRGSHRPTPHLLQRGDTGQEAGLDRQAHSRCSRSRPERVQREMRVRPAGGLVGGGGRRRADQSGLPQPDPQRHPGHARGGEHPRTGREGALEYTRRAALEAGRIRDAVDPGPRDRHQEGTPPQDLRSLLHDQADGQWPGARRGSFDHRQARWACPRGIRARGGHDISDLSPRLRGGGRGERSLRRRTSSPAREECC